MTSRTFVPSIAIFATTIITPAVGDCMFTQSCTGFPPECIPTMYDTPQPSFPLGPSPFHPCPQYESNGCCNLNQAGVLSVSLSLLKTAFGDINSGGCPACLANAETFWCEYTCSPWQSEFITHIGYANATDPNTGETFTVLQSTIRVDKDFSCGTYDSCSGVSTVRKDSSLGNMEGFFTYQGDTQGIGHGNQILFQFVDPAASNSSETMRTPLLPPGQGALGRKRLASALTSSQAGTNGASADSNGHTANGYAATDNSLISGALFSCCNFPLSLETGNAGDAGVNTSCPCSSCQGMCSGGTCPWGERAGGSGSDGADAFPNLGLVTLSPMYGFSGSIVGGMYGAIAGLSLLALGYRTWFSGPSRGGSGTDGEEEEEGDDRQQPFLGSASTRQQWTGTAGTAVTLQD